MKEERCGRPPGLQRGHGPAGAVVEEVASDEEGVELRHHLDQRIARLFRGHDKAFQRHTIAPVLLPALGRVVGEGDRRFERKVGVVFDREHPCPEAFQQRSKHPQIGRVEIDRDVIGLRRHPMPRQHLDDVRGGEKLTVEIDGGVFMAAVEEQRPPTLMENEIGDIRPEATGERITVKPKLHRQRRRVDRADLREDRTEHPVLPPLGMAAFGKLRGGQFFDPAFHP